MRRYRSFMRSEIILCAVRTIYAYSFGFSRHYYRLYALIQIDAHATNKEQYHINKIFGGKTMSEQLTLRTFELTDNEFIHGLINNPDIMNYWFEEPYHSKTLIDERFEKEKNDPHTRSFILTNGEESLGLIQLIDIHYVHRKAEFAIMIDPKQQGKGYSSIATRLAMDYAFKTLNLHKLYLYVDEINEKAIHVYEKCGYQTVATLPEEFFVDGSYHNVIVMNMYKRDYEKMIAEEK